MAFIKATKIVKKARIGLAGPAGSGKTLSALLIAKVFGKKIAVIDAENFSSVAYAGDVILNGKTIRLDFDVNALQPPYTIDKYIAALDEAGDYDVVIIDGISPAWAGEGGLLEKVDQIASRSNSKNSYFAWRNVTPEHNKFIDAMLHCKTNLIVTMRSKVEYALVENDKGKVVPKKMGLAPIQREGMDYEFDIVFDIDINHSAVASKDRSAMFDGLIIEKLNEEHGKMIFGWCNKGENVSIEKAIKEIGKQIDLNELKTVWDKFPMFHRDNDFKTAATQIKANITDQKNEPEQPESESEPETSEDEAAEKAITEMSQEVIVKINTNLLTLARAALPKGTDEKVNERVDDFRMKFTGCKNTDELEGLKYKDLCIKHGNIKKQVVNVEAVAEKYKEVVSKEVKDLQNDLPF